MQIKEKLFLQINQELDQKIDSSLLEIASIKEARNNDTKSSAGDKHETGRAMAQIELDKREAAFNRNLKLKKEISNINLEKNYEKVEFGSLVMTSMGNYFACFALGKYSVENQDYYTISLGSPIGQVLLSKRVGDIFLFQEKEIKVVEIY